MTHQLALLLLAFALAGICGCLSAFALWGMRALRK